VWYLLPGTTEEGVMTPFSPEASQAFLNAELGAVTSLLQSAPLGAVVLLAAVVVAVGWLTWTEKDPHRSRHRHVKA
jgi:hypothetical protein